MAKSRARYLSELLNSEGLVQANLSALAGADGIVDLEVLPTIPNSQLEHSSVSIAGHTLSLGESLTLNTADIGEHESYLYYTNARARAAVSASGSLSYDSATGILSFTERTDSEVRGLLSAGGDLAYNSSTGVISFTERTDSEVRGLVSASESLSYDSATGVFSYTTPTTIASLSNHSTDGLSEGSTNLYFTNARVRSAISVSGAGSYDSGTGVITITGGVTSVNTQTGAVTLTTDNIAEGSTNLYYTSARANTDFDTRLATKSTTNLSEGTNLYYTDARVGSYLTTNSYATESYVGTQIANLVDTAPTTLDTLNELAAALGDDANFSTTVTNSIATKWTQDNTKISNWDTAYGWGNHASAGYLVSSSYTAADVLAKLITVDGASSGLDADLLDGNQSSFFADKTNNQAFAGSLALGTSASDTSNLKLDVQGNMAIRGANGLYFGVSTNNVNSWTTRLLASGSTQYINAQTFILNNDGYGNTFSHVFNSSGLSILGNTAWHSGNDGSGSGLDADLLDGLQLHTGRNNEANKVVRTDGNGYIQAGWINTPSGAFTSTINKIYASDDDYIRYVTPSTLISNLGLWTSSNDGSGSGLDADLLDGLHGDAYLRDDGWNTYPGQDANTQSGMRSDFSYGNNCPYTGELLRFGASGYSLQMSSAYTSTALTIRTRNGDTGNWNSWATVWTSLSDGSGSGLDADLLDGLDSTRLLRFVSTFGSGQDWDSLANTSYTMRVDEPNNGMGGTGAPGNYPYGQVWSSKTANHNFQLYAAHTASAGDGLRYRTGWVNGYYGWAKIWDSVNDGSGSGLDADLLDGMNATSSVTGSTVVARDGNGYIYANHINFNTSETENPSISSFLTSNGDGWSRKSSKDHVRSQLGLVWGSSGKGTTNIAFASTANSDSGFYDVYNNGTPTGTWYSMVNMAHYGGNHGHQIAGSFYSAGDLYNRNNSNTTFSGWTKIWNAANDGSGSGLDADLLDGYHSAENGASVNLRTASNGYLYLNNWMHPANGTGLFYDAGVHFYESGNNMYSSTGFSSANQGYLWGASNDGSGSGLDADLLDGVHGSSFLRSDADDSFSGRLTSTVSAGSVALDLSSNDGYANMRVIRNSGTGNLDGMYIGYGNGSSGATRIFGGGATSGGIYITGSGANSITYNNASVLWHAGNDGSGSGLDADLLDGIDSGSFARRDVNNTYASNTINYFQVDRGGFSGSLVNGNLQVYSASNNSAFMSFHKGGQYAVNMGLDEDNVLRIGGWSASANRWVLDMSGNMTAAGNVTAYSDIRLKENIKVIPDALEKVQKIRGVTFTRNDQDDKEKLHAGVIAQEVEAVLPEVISEDNLGIKNVAYGNMVGLLIEAIKELKAEVDDLKAQLKEK